MRIVSLALVFAATLFGCRCRSRSAPGPILPTRALLERDGEARFRERALEFIRSADRVDLVFESRYWDNDGEHPPDVHQVTDRTRIRGIVSLVDLRPQEACECDDDEAIIFHKGRDSLTVSICDHCFDVVPEPGSCASYEMPQALYREFTRFRGTYARKAPSAEPADGE